MFQQHPFTLLSTHPATFVIQAQEGFTKELHLAACRNPGGRFRAATEGPYCVVPDTGSHDKVILIAGGTGATFTVAVALEWARKNRVSAQRATLDFVWIVRNEACLEWLDFELSELKECLGVSIDLYVSGVDPVPDDSIRSSSDFQLEEQSTNSSSSIELQSWSEDGYEKMINPGSSQRPISKLSSVRAYKTGRPDLPNLIRQAVGGLEVDDRVLVIGE